MLAGLALAFSCAQPISPTGGPRDEQPPRVLRTAPDSASLRFDGKEVTFYFDEAIRKPAMNKEVFISPFVLRPELRFSDSYRRFTLRFNEDLRPNTTYVVTLTGIKDNHEGSEMKTAYSLAFSTGEVLDSLSLQGQVLGPVIGQGQKDVKLLLFDADSIQQQQFTGKRPAYLTKASDAGAFNFQYLRRVPYAILGVVDADQSNTYSQPSEIIAMPAAQPYRWPDSAARRDTLILYAFLPDELPPAVRSYGWMHPQALSLRFSESLRLDSARFALRDTSGVLIQDSLLFTWAGGTDKELLIRMPDTLTAALECAGLRDSIGLRSDTTLRINPLRKRDPAQPLVQRPVLDPACACWTFTAWRVYSPEDSARFTLTASSGPDSLRAPVPLALRFDGFRVTAAPRQPLDPKGSYLLRLRETRLPPSPAAGSDSVYTYPLGWFDPADLGTLSGSVKLDSSYQGPVAVLLLDSKKAIVRTARDTVFQFTHLPAGAYTFRIILDQDGNGIWTTGSLPRSRLPERIFEAPEPVTVRANWDFEGHVVEVNTRLKISSGPSGKGGAEAAAPPGAPAPAGPRRPAGGN
ncbi:MAG: Ig-like domain-containing protein [Bacteroidia bacterium]|nr:Ig-like domain-containing protein [Bacteroidia bacterium]